MRIMTANIWGDYFDNPVSVREKDIMTVFEKYSPDVIGLQEITQGWYNANLFEWLSKEYRIFGTELADSDNFVPFVAKRQIKMLAKGYEYLIETPDASKAITWATLEKDGIRFAVCNTHFWWKSGEEHDKIRVVNAEQLTALMKYLNKRFECPVFAFGDMNTTISSNVFKVYKKNGIVHLYDIADAKDDISSHHGNPVKDEREKYHGKITCNDYTHSIDHIVMLGGENVKVSQYRIVTDTEALDATDHSPVFADVEFVRI